MKRKLNDRNIPEAVSLSAQIPATPTFDSFDLDPRLLQAVEEQKWARPTPVQAAAIPVALRGKDILVRARTGTGKTAAYLLPILNTILKRKAKQSRGPATTALILVPTKELASQVAKAISTLSIFCSKAVGTLDITQPTPELAQQAALAASPDVVVATPAKAVHHAITSALKLDRLAHLVIDEADLVLSYGSEKEARDLVNLLPRGLQASLVSATLTTDVDILKGIFCRDPVTLHLQEDEKDSNTVNQYVVRCGEDEKFLILFAVCKLKLLSGKAIIFAGDVDRCYMVKLYLEQFGIKSCVLNSELPANCRIHIAEEFNKGVYDIIIASDEHEVVGNEQAVPKTTNSTLQHESSSMDATEHVTDLQSSEQRTSGTTKTQGDQIRKQGKKKDREFGISRGIDFQDVACVLNFDLPTSAKSYIHRIGRTARAGKGGIALSFIIPQELFRKDKRTTLSTTKDDEATLDAITRSQHEKGQKIQPYHFDMTKLEGFRYRVASALKVVTPGAVRQARVMELRQELLKSEKLKRHLEENPNDLRYLRHDMEVRATRVQPQLRHVPEYLLPTAGNGKVNNLGQPIGAIGFVGPGPQSSNRIREARARNKLRARRGRKVVKKTNPLKTFKANRRT